MVVSRQFHALREGNPPCALHRRLGEPQIQSESAREKKICCPCLELKNIFFWVVWLGICVLCFQTYCVYCTLKCHLALLLYCVYNRLRVLHLCCPPPPLPLSLESDYNLSEHTSVIPAPIQMYTYCHIHH